MSEWLLNAVHERLRSMGVDARRHEGALVFGDAALVTRAAMRDGPDGTVQVQADFEIRSARLPAPLLESFGAIASTSEAAEREALDKFLRGSLHVVAESLAGVDVDGAELDWEEWPGAQGHWRVCSGPLLMVATRHDQRIEGYPEFFAALQQRFTSDMASGPHWMRVFVGSLDGQRKASEVIVDGSEWMEATRMLEEHGWSYPPGYASLRHLLIALPH